MSIRRGMLFTLGAKIKNLVDAFKARVLNTQGEFEAESCLNTQLTQLDNQSLLDNASLVVTPNGYEENLLFAVEPNDVGTNLFTRSEEFENAAWTKTSVLSITQNTITAPNGLLTADTIRLGIAASPTRYRLSQQQFYQTGITYTTSYYLKKANHRWIQLNYVIDTAFGVSNWANFDLENGVIGNTGAGAIATITDVGNGWYRCSLQAIAIASGNTTGCEIVTTNNTNSGRYPSYQSTVAEDVCYVWGAQLVPGSVATNYISTTDRQIINGTIGDMSVTRATTATRVNSDRFIEQVPYNLFQQSQNLENAYWNKQRTTIVQDVIIAPDGTLTADNLIANSGVTYLYTGANGVNVVSTSFTQRGMCTVSFYLKYNGLNRIRVMYGVATTISGGNYVEVDLQLGIITNSDLVTNPFIEDVGNGWYRVGFTDNITSATNNRFGVGLGDTVKTIANGIDGVYIWGAQLVDGDLVKDYFPTTNGFNVPRIDYSNGSCPSILVEPQRTNLVIQSEQINLWTGGLNTTVTPNVSIGPNGTQSANNINITNTNGYWRRLGLNLASSTTYTASVFVKKSATTNNKTFSFYYNNNVDSPNNGVYSAVVNLTNLTITTTPFGTITTGRPTIISSLLSDYGNGWYRVIVIFTTGSSAGSSNSEIGFQANGEVVDFDAWGAQLEAGTNATSYIPTVASTVTRNADVITNTNASTLIGQTEGTLYCEFNFLLNVTVGRLLAISDGTTNNRIFLNMINNRVQGFVARSNVIQYIFSSGVLSNGKNKVAIAYKQDDFAMYLNGVQINVSNTGNIPVILNTAYLASSEFGATPSSISIINLASIWKTRLTNTQLQNLTAL